MSGIFYCPSELTEPWGLELPPMPNCVWFHVVTAGVCNVEVNGETRQLRSGDLALIPHGAGHRAWGIEPAPTLNVFDLPHDYYSDQYALLSHGGGGDRTSVVCGGIRSRWRMHVALELLRNGDDTVAATAAQVGYDSEAAFSRAFKRVIGTTPRSARHTDRVGPLTSRA